MGKNNIKVKQFLRNKKRFADLFNGAVFEGEQIVKPEELEEIDSEVGIIVQDKNNVQKGVQRYRDITMIWKSEVELSILACENQNKVHYAMPVRMMLYDSLTYSDQIRQMWKNRKQEIKITGEEFLSQFRKEDKIYPVISLVFYYGKEKWDACTDLYGMFSKEILSIRESIVKKYICNYSINLIDTADVGEVSRFQSDLQLIFGMLKYKNEKDSMRIYLNEHKEYFQSVDTETYQAIGELLHSEKQLKAIVENINEKERWDMCKAFEDMYNDGVTDGIEKGITAFIEVCKEFEISKETICQKLKDKFSVSEEKAMEYLKKHEG